MKLRQVSYDFVFYLLIIVGFAIMDACCLSRTQSAPPCFIKSKLYIVPKFTAISTSVVVYGLSTPPFTLPDFTRLSRSNA